MTNVKTGLQDAETPGEAKLFNGDGNRLLQEDKPAHGWYRFVLSFPPHLVRAYLDRFGVTGKQCVLDPFCGTGTTLVECKKRGIRSIGVEAHPMLWFASVVKTNWTVDPTALRSHAGKIARAARKELEASGIVDGDNPMSFVSPTRLRKLTPEREKLLLTNSISPLPLHKTLTLLSHLERSANRDCRNHELLALAKALVSTVSNLHFGPEVGVGPPKEDAPAIGPWLSNVEQMCEDLVCLKDKRDVPAQVHNLDSREIGNVLAPQSVDAVITSPPYPNEKDYTRTTRLESVLLGFVQTKAQLAALKQGLMRSNTRNVYKGDDDDQWIADHPKIQEIADQIEARRLALGKTSGFERLYARVTKLYFGGMARHLAGLRKVLRPGANLAYVVGDQASYLRVMIRTGQLLAEIAESLGYVVAGIDLFRTRLATATRAQLREEVLLLRWPG